MTSPEYRTQVDLLLRVLPFVATEQCFALKGGTAINLFVRDMPRLSVDIDLTYLPFDARSEALDGISQALHRIKARLDNAIPGITARTQAQSDDHEAKLLCTLQGATIKVEVNTIIRGHLWPVRQMQIVEAAQSEFQKFATIQVVSHAELFGGKICAALDRQHPRDLFDVRQLLEREGVTEDVRLGFIASLLSHSRPMNELLRPRLQDQRKFFETQFSGMTIEPFAYEEFGATRERLIEEIHALLTDKDRQFLIRFKDAEPDWSLFPAERLQEMPAVKWKLTNIRRLKKQNPAKHKAQLRALETCLNLTQ